MTRKHDWFAEFVDRQLARIRERTDPAVAASAARRAIRLRHAQDWLVPEQRGLGQPSGRRHAGQE
jgi:hypothetical protein